jgi:histidinol-phosphate aminotransferase
VSDAWKELVRQPLRGQAAYHVPSFPNAIKLDANESPFALSKTAFDAVLASLSREVNRYPDASARELRGVLAGKLGVEADQISFGNGSDESIALLCAAFGEPRKKSKAPSILYPWPSFVVYRTAAMAHGMNMVEVPLGPRFEADENALLEAVAREKPNLVFLATPNNPTGTVWPRATIAKLLVQHPDVITVVDEAYLPYAEARTCIDLALAHPHCLVLQTLSKAGLAGLRVGYVVGRREVIAEVEKVRPPYNLNSLSLRAATVLLRDHHAELDRHVAEVKTERARLFAELAKVPELEVFPSDANLFMVRAPDATALYEQLAERGVLVRNFDKPGVTGPLTGCMRITVGTREENDWLLDALRAIRAARS